MKRLLGLQKRRGTCWLTAGERTGTTSREYQLPRLQGGRGKRETTPSRCRHNGDLLQGNAAGISCARARLPDYEATR